MSRTGPWAVLAMLVIASGACGCGGSAPQGESVPAAPDEPPPAVVAAPAPPPPVARPLVAPKPLEVEPAPPPPPRLPDDVATWSADDFRLARRQGDYRLPQAIGQLPARAAKGEGFDQESAAELLIELLPADSAPGAGEPPPPDALPAAKPDRTVVLAIIPALAAGGTRTARRALEKLVNGTLPTGVDEPQVVEPALAALATRFGENGELVLYTAIAAPETLRAGSTEVPPARLRQLALPLAAQVTSPSFRARLVDVFLDRSQPREVTVAVERLLLEPVAANMAAQVELFARSETPPELLTRLRPVFVAQTRAALFELLNVPPELLAALPAPSASPGMRGGVGGSLPAPGREGAYLVARHLWGERFVEALVRRAPELGETARLLEWLALATALPAADVRRGLAELMTRYWDEGTRDLKLGRRFGEVILDPGALVIVKSAPRVLDPAVRDRRQGRTSDARNGPRRGNPPAPSDREKARYEWMQASEEFVLVICERLHQVALAQRLLGAGHAQQPAAGPIRLAAYQVDPIPDQPDRPEDDPFGTAAQAGAGRGAPPPLPVTLDKGAEILAEYHVTWPDDLEDRPADVIIAPLAIHYVRAKVNDRLTAIASGLQQQLGGVRSRPLENQGRWLDQLAAGSAPGRLRSVDVVVTRLSTDAAPARPGNEDLQIEVLSIEILDPFSDAQHQRIEGEAADDESPADQDEPPADGS